MKLINIIKRKLYKLIYKRYYSEGVPLRCIHCKSTSLYNEINIFGLHEIHCCECGGGLGNEIDGSTKI